MRARHSTGCQQSSAPTRACPPPGPGQPRWQCTAVRQWRGRVAVASRCRPVAYVPRQPSPSHPRPGQTQAQQHAQPGTGQAARAGAPRQGGGPGPAGQARAARGPSAAGRNGAIRSGQGGRPVTVQCSRGRDRVVTGTAQHNHRHGRHSTDDGVRAGLGGQAAGGTPPGTACSQTRHSDPPAAPRARSRTRSAQASAAARARPAQARTVTGQPAKPGTSARTAAQHIVQPYITAPPSTTQPRHNTTTAGWHRERCSTNRLGTGWHGMRSVSSVYVASLCNTTQHQPLLSITIAQHSI